MTNPASLVPWHHFYAADVNTATLHDQGSVGADAVLSTNGAAGFAYDTTSNPWPVEKWQDGINTRYLVNRTAPTYTGPLTVAAFVKGSIAGTLFAQILTTTNRVLIMKADHSWRVEVNGVESPQHPELRNRWSLVVAVVDGANSYISENGNAMPWAGPTAASVSNQFAVMGVNNAWSNMTPTAFRWVGVYQGAITAAQRDALYAYATAEGLEMEAPVGSGAPTEAQAKLDATPDGGVCDLADKVYVQEVPLVILNRNNLTVLGPRLQAFTTGANEPAPLAGVDTYNWPRSRSHIAITHSTNITLFEPAIKGPMTLAEYKVPLEGQAGIFSASNDGVRIIRPVISNVHGDGLELWDLHTTVIDPDISVVGRQGISANRVDGLNLIGGTIAGCARSGLDIEPYTAAWYVRNVVIHGLDVSDCGNLPLAMGGAGPIDNVDISECVFDVAWLILRGSNVTFRRNRAGFAKAPPSGQAIHTSEHVHSVDNTINAWTHGEVVLVLNDQATASRTWTNGTLLQH